MDFEYIFEKKIKNSDKFRQQAIRFEQTGSYCDIPFEDKIRFKEFWDIEIDRSIYGYTAPDGDWISGYYYFYLNYCPIQQTIVRTLTDRSGVEYTVEERQNRFPLFFDYDYHFFTAVEEAEKQHKHLCVLKSRRKGYSYKCASMMVRNLLLIRESKSYAYASGLGFLTGDGIMTKVSDYLGHCDENTAFAKRRSVKDTATHKRCSFIKKNAMGNKIEAGYKSEVIAESISGDPDKVRGKAGKLILFEEAGKMPELEAAWNIARPSVETDGKAWGLMIAFGTGGSDNKDFTSLKKMFYSPEAYNMLSMKNIWDKGNPDKKCGFFCPQYANMIEKDADGKYIYMDEDGNTNIPASLKKIGELRQPIIENALTTQYIDSYIAENCITPQEACLEVSSSIMPKAELMDHLASIRTHEAMQAHKQVGMLERVGNSIRWISKPGTDIQTFDLKKEDSREGAIVIWEHPPESPQYGIYIAGCLTPGEMVMTDSGLMPVEDVSFDDKLINMHGVEVDINTLLRYYKEDERIYNVKMSNTLRRTTFTQEHPIYVSDTKYNKDMTIDESSFSFDFKTMENVKVGQWVKVPNMYRNKTNGNFVKDTVFLSDYYWWFSGLWLGDGYCDKNGRITISCNINEKSTINNLRKAIDSFGCKYHSRVRENCVEITFTHKRFSEWLEKHFGKYANNKFISESIKRMPNKDKCDLLKGYLDSDGCVYLDSKRSLYSMEFVSTSLVLLEDIQDICFGMLAVGNLTKMRDESESEICGRTIAQKKCYHLRFGHNDSLWLSNLLQSEIRSEKLDGVVNVKSTRNRPKSGCFISSCGEYIYIQIKEIEQSLYTGIVYNFDCDTHTFMCHHITTHNCDPYDHNSSSTDSLGSVIVYKRFQNFEEYYDLPVAEYTGRPYAGADAFYENTRLLLEYYNARMMYENEKTGLFSYFKNNYCDHLLADQPDIIRDIVPNSTVKRGKGIHMSEKIKDFGETKIRDWLLEEYAPGKKNLTKILSEPLLEELIQFNRKSGNYDRVMAFMVLMVYREELHNMHIKIGEDAERESKQRLFESPIFTGYY